MKKVPKYVTDLVDKFVDLFDVRAWGLGIKLEKRNYKDAAAKIVVDEKYQRITIHLYPSFFSVSRQYQREYLLHEFCHLVTTPLVDRLDDVQNGNLVTQHQILFESERATSRMTNILDGFLTGGWLHKRQAYKAFLQKPKPKRKLRKRQQV